MFRSFVIIGIFALSVFSMGSAQTVKRSNEVLGMSGTVSILPNPNATHTTIVFISTTPLTPTSNQLVLVLQAASPLLPPAWSGHARLLTGDGFVAVAPEGNSEPKWLLKFTDREIPPLLAHQSFQVFDIFGIARYGEGTQLTPDQIENLASTGRTCGPIARNKTKEYPTGDSPIEDQELASPMHAGPVCPAACTSGGDGSSQCSSGSGGCSVTCGTGTYSCCNVNTNQCGCCKPE